MIRDPFTITTPLIVASILSADFSNLGDEIREVLDAGADMIHLDILDGHFAPNLSFGPPVIQKIRPITPAYFDAHLMIAEPLRYGPAMARAGANGLTFHFEAVADPIAAARTLGKLGRVGIALNPATPVDRIEPVLDEVDLVLVMSVVPGFSGQKFMPEVLDKCRRIKRRLRADQRIEIDGGIKPDNIRQARDAGVDWFVVASAIFDSPDRFTAIAELRGQLA